MLIGVFDSESRELSLIDFANPVVRHGYFGGMLDSAAAPPKQMAATDGVVLLIQWLRVSEED